MYSNYQFLVGENHGKAERQTGSVARAQREVPDLQEGIGLYGLVPQLPHQSHLKGEEMKRKGSYISDRSGLYHFQWKVGGTTVMDAAVQAIIGHPGDPAWFWFNEIPAPIYMDDTPSKLVRRWEKYRKAAALGAEEFVKLLINLPFTATA